MVQERQQEIVNELLNYMDTLEDGSEVSTWDLMDEVFNYQRFNDPYIVFMILKSARKNLFR